MVGGSPVFDDFTEATRRERERDAFHKSHYSPFVLVYDTMRDSWHRMPSRLPFATNDIRVVIDGKKNLYALGGENIEPATSNTTPWLRVGKLVLRAQ